MYLKKSYIINSGPLTKLKINMEFSSNGNPKPLVLVGSNGGGKTNFLSLVTDALFEAAVVHYQDALPRSAVRRSWFRVVGGLTATVGTPGGFSILQFAHQGKDLFYKEKSGNISQLDAKSNAPQDLWNAINWENEGSYKEFSLSDEQSKQIFNEGTYVYFPSSRSEIPFWLNRESIKREDFETFANMANTLRKPIFVERSIHQFKQWLLALMLDSRIEILPLTAEQNRITPTATLPVSVASRNSLEIINKILRKILGDEHVSFTWLGRKNSDKIGISKNDKLLLPTIDCLSSGQSILLGMFGTILRYADQSTLRADIAPSDIEGICIIDEIDAHIHIDLQHRILPELISFFPKIQFIVSSHSPIFVLGMQTVFGTDGFQIVEMPSGNTVTTETYSEFRKAMEVLAATSSFNNNLITDSSKFGRPLILTEGETDAPYLRRAAHLLGREQLLERCEIDWIGAKDDNGQGFNTGKAALDHALALLRANPQLANRPILLLYDNDAKKINIDYGNISVRSLPTNQANNKVKCGIENLLPESSIREDDYYIIEKSQDNGDIVRRQTLKKSHLNSRLIQSGSAEDFQYFGAALDLIESFVDNS